MAQWVPVCRTNLHVVECDAFSRSYIGYLNIERSLFYVALLDKSFHYLHFDDSTMATCFDLLPGASRVTGP